jgi:hypothetical protein
MLSHVDVFGGRGGGSELERKWPPSRPGRYVPEKITPVPIWEKSGWAQGMSELQQKKKILPYEESNLVVQLKPIHYTG